MPKTHLNKYQYLQECISELNDDPAKHWSEYPCITWDSCRHESYGILHVGGLKHGKTRRAHRVAYELTHGPLSDPGLCVCHHCDNPPCFRPSHLFVGTNHDNVRDMIAKGRRFQYIGSGDWSGSAKLGDEDVQRIHILHLLGVSNGRVAKLFNVRQSCISRIVTGKRWRNFNTEKGEMLH